MKFALVLLLLAACTATSCAVTSRAAAPVLEIDYFSVPALQEHIAAVGQIRGFTLQPPEPETVELCAAIGADAVLGYVPETNTVLCFKPSTLSDVDARAYCTARMLPFLRHDAAAHKVFCLAEKSLR